MCRAIAEGNLNVLEHSGQFRSRALWTREDECYTIISRNCFGAERVKLTYLIQRSVGGEIAGAYKAPVVLGAGREVLV
jgi:hypothetical protein